MNKDSSEYKSNKSLVFEVSENDISKFNHLRDFIFSSLEKGQIIELSIFKQFLSLLKKKKLEDKLNYSAKLVVETIEYFTIGKRRQKEYTFERIEEIRVPVPTKSGKEKFLTFKIKYNLENLINSVFFSVSNLPELNSKRSDIIVKRCYLAIESYLNSCFKTHDEHEFFTHYKRTVLAAYITSKLGCQFLKQKKDPQPGYDPEQWFGMAQGQVSKIPPEQIRFHPNKIKKH